MTVRIAARLTKDEQEHNGLDAIADTIVKDGPGWRGIAVVKLSRARFTHEDDLDTDIPTVRIDHIEPLFGDAADRAHKACTAAYHKRLGRAALWDDDEQLDENPDADQEPVEGRPYETVELPDAGHSTADPVFGDLDSAADDEERTATSTARRRINAVHGGEGGAQ